MNLSKLTGLVFACIVIVLTATSCGKKVSPQAIKQSRLDWNLKTLVTAYQESGNTDSKWDEAATNALTEFARSRSAVPAADEPVREIILTNVAAAVQAGCDDPMIRYLYIKFAMDETNSSKDFADAYTKTADDLQQSSYPDIRKFYASLRALQQVYYADGTNADRQTVRQLANNLVENLVQVFTDKTTPMEELYEAGSQGLYELSGSERAYDACYNQIEQPLFKNWPKESVSWLLKGEAYIQMGWFARGNGYADTITDEGAKAFAADLAIAEKSLNQAWKLNPKDERIPLKMMNVELGQGKGHDTMELWFSRAMALDQNDYEACNAKLLYIEPKWYGSIQDMLNFGRECVQNTNWGGRIPLILVNAHLDIAQQYIDKSERTNYWKQPEVWADIQSAYNKCFQINPNAVDLYYYYARFAYRAEDWPKMNELIPKLGAPVDYNFFGGKDEFDQMVQLAKEHAKPAAASQ